MSQEGKRHVCRRRRSSDATVYTNYGDTHGGSRGTEEEDDGDYTTRRRPLADGVPAVPKEQTDPGGEDIFGASGDVPGSTPNSILYVVICCYVLE